MGATIDRLDIKRALAAILDSPQIQRAPMQARALTVMVERTLEGVETTAADLSQQVYGRSDPSYVKAIRQVVRELRYKLPIVQKEIGELDVCLRIPETGYGLIWETFKEEPLGSYAPRRHRIGRALSRNIRSVWAKFSAAALAIGALVAAATWLAGLVGDPAKCEVAGKWLRVLDSEDRVIWQEYFEDLSQESYSRIYTGVDYLLTDIDGDGATEVLFNLVREGRLEEGSVLLCFGAEGEHLWSYEYGKNFRSDDPKLTPSFDGLILMGVMVDGHSYLFTVAKHRRVHPSEVALIDQLHGKAVATYYHPGYLYSAKLFDWDTDGRQDVVLGGINNPGDGIGHPVLLVLGLPFGVDPSQEVPSHTDFFGNPGPKEKAYLVFPQNCVARASTFGARVKQILMSKGRGLEVETDVHGEYSITYSFDLSRQGEPRLLNVSISDLYIKRHNELFREGVLDHAWSGLEKQALSRILMMETAPDGNDAAIEEQFRLLSSSLTDGS